MWMRYESWGVVGYVKGHGHSKMGGSEQELF